MHNRAWCHLLRLYLQTFSLCGLLPGGDRASERLRSLKLNLVFFLLLALALVATGTTVLGCEVTPVKSFQRLYRPFSIHS